MLAALEVLREELAASTRGCPSDVEVVLHPRPAALALAQPWLPLARRAAAPAAAALLWRAGSASRDPRARAAGARAAASRRARLARGAAADAPARVRAPRGGCQQPVPAAALLAVDLPPLRALGLAVRGRGHAGCRARRRCCARPSCGGCARAAGRRSRPSRATRCCSAARCSPCSSRSAAARPRAALATSDLERGPRSVLVDAFGRQLAGVERDWRELLDPRPVGPPG